jgi:hypothetical protein
MRPLARRVGLLALLLPQVLHAQGRQTKVNYEENVKLGSQALVEGHSTYFQILTTPAAEDPAGGLIRYWGPELDRFYENVCANLQLAPDEVRRYLLHPDLFAELEQLVLEGRLHAAWIDSILGTLETDSRGHDASMGQPGSPQAGTDAAVDAPPARTRALRIDRPVEPPSGLVFDTERRERRWDDRHTEWSGEALLVWLPDAGERLFQRCVLYRTLHDFLATPIGPSLPEGVLGFVPRHDPSLPIVIYASLGEERLRRTAQHEIAHAVVETIAKYHRRLAVARVRNAKPAVPAEGWKPQRGGFSAITHENFAEYLSFPHGQMDPVLRAALVEMVAENRLDGLAALSVGARTLASSYVEGPARLTFLADRFGRDMPKKLLHSYYTNSLGFLNVLEDLTGHSVEALEQLYRRWLRESLWTEHLNTAIPDTIGTVLATGLSGVHRDGATLVHRARDGRQEIALIQPGRREVQTHVIARDLDGIERLPLFTSPDLRRGQVVSVVRNQNKEALLLWSAETGTRLRPLHELGAVREVRDPRFSPSARRVVFRVVDRSGRNAIGLLDRDGDAARLLTTWQWTQVSDPSFADDEAWVLYSSTDTPDHRADLFVLHVDTDETRNLTNTPGVSETEPVLVNGRLVCFSDHIGVPTPVEWLPGGSPRVLLNLPFAMSGLERSDSTLTLVANSLRHRRLPAQRALWSFPLSRLGLDTPPPAPETPARPEGWPVFAVLAAAPGPDAAAPQDDVTTAATAAATPAPPAWLGRATASPALDVALRQPAATHETIAIDVQPYHQKWRLMPLGINLSNADARSHGVSFMGIDTEFHDQSFLVAAGQRAEFDRFATLMYRNRSARMHWETGVYHRSMMSGRFYADSTSTYDRNQSETQYHKSLVTRLGFGMAVAHRTDTDGDVVVRRDNQEAMRTEAPVLSAKVGGIDPRAWQLALGGVEDLAMLADASSVGLAQFENAARQLAAKDEREFIPSVEYVRSNMTLGVSLSRDTRVWSDYRGPRAGHLLTISATSGFNAPGDVTYIDAAQQDSLQHHVAAGLDRVGLAAMFLTHRRITFLDVAVRLRAFADHGPGELIYGIGGLYSVAGFPRGFLRSPRVAYTNLEMRAPLWNYGLLTLPIRSLTLPAGEGFAFLDAGVADGGGSIYSYGVGLRLKLGFLTYEWRHVLRDGLRNQNGFVLAW